MADVKHTPGPWQLLEVGDKSPRLCPADKHGGSILTVVEESGVTFAVVYSDADARLISAAPDLLEALQDLFGADMEYVLMGDGKDDQVAAIAKALAAIAKATGTTALKGSAEHERQQGRFYDQ